MRFSFKSSPADLFSTAARLVLGGVFLWASFGKILNPQAFSHAILNYQMVPPGLSNLIALVLPWVELVCGLGLILNRWSRGSALVTAFLMVVFTAALGFNIYRGIDVSCGCFTLDEAVPGNMWFYLVRDVLFCLLAISVMRSSHPSPHRSGARKSFVKGEVM